MGYKKDYRLLKLWVDSLKSRYNFKGLYHFTDFSNLEQIFKTGFLYSRNQCIMNHIKFIDGANHDVLDKASKNIHDKVRFYYRPKTPTLYDNEGVKLKEYCDNIHIPMPVYLLFDEELILLDSTEFSDGNATSSKIDNTSSFFSHIDWDSVFHDTWFEPEDRNYIINKRQAELLSSEPVSINKYLKKIIFRCEADKKRAINVYGHNYKYEVDSSIFSDKNFKGTKKKEYENNYINNYDIDYNFDDYGNKKDIIITVNFQKKWNDYKSKFNIEDFDGLSLRNNASVFYKKYNPQKTIEFIGTNGNVWENYRTYNEKVRLKITGPIKKFKKIEIYINDYLYIEENLKKNVIEKYYFEIKKEDNKENYFFNILFKDVSILKYSHRYKIFDNRGCLVEDYSLIFDDKKNCLNWYIEFENYNSNWYKIKYYIDDVMYICETINNAKISYKLDKKEK